MYKWTDDCTVHWRIYASIGPNDLKHVCVCMHKHCIRKICTRFSSLFWTAVTLLASQWQALNVRGPNDFSPTESLSCLLMPWPLASSGHHHPRYWICSSCLTWRRILTTRVMSMWRNGINCKYMFFASSEKGLVWFIYPYFSRMFHLHCGHRMVDPVSVKYHQTSNISRTKSHNLTLYVLNFSERA